MLSRRALFQYQRSIEHHTKRGSLDVKFQLGKEWVSRLRSPFMAGAKRSQVIESAKLQSGILAVMELDPN